MAGQLSQDERVAEFSTPLGKDALVLTNFSGSEGLGKLFEYRIEAISEQEDIDFDQAIGQGCMLKIKSADNKTRIFHGIMTEAEWDGIMDEYYRYRMVLRPWFWLLGRRADCRIFLDKNVKDIMQEVFTKAGFTDFEFRTTGEYQKIPYCVQYRESDLDFVSRLMELYGIYYFFEPSEGKHTMVLADSYSSHKPIPDLPKVQYNPSARDNQDNRQMFRTWVSARSFHTGKVQFNDYDYLQPKKNLLAHKEASEKYTHSKLELYDYPGKYDDKGKGEKLAQFRLEAEQSFDHRRNATGDAVCLYPGGLVSLEEHQTSAENREYLIVNAGHNFAAQHYRTAVVGGGQGYSGTFQIMPSDRPFRSLPKTPKPRIYGIQTAKVVGKKGEDGEEISTDENGHIWVQFYWDREPQKTCPIRVAQVWASKQWGGQFIPRIGMEVVVQFLEGDPDRPLVTGAVYNGDLKHPYDLPDNKTQSGVKSDSSKGHNGYNEFMFEDKKGEEFIRMHAEKDHQVTVKNSQTVNIGEIFMPPKGSPSRNITLKNGDDQLTIQMGDHTISIPMGSQSTTAMITITHTVGMTSVTLTPAAKSVESPVINHTAEATINHTAGATINHTAPVINLNGVVNIVGGLTVDGMVPMLLPA